MGDYPPGFRFHPTDEELVNYYLSRKVANKVIHGNIIAEVDLYKCEPWDVPEKSALKENEWYFFSPRDRKYPNGSRTNRATTKGYWKATGKDRVVLASPKGAQSGLKKTLVFYQGRAPKGGRTDWIMHEYRLEKANGEFSPGQDAFVLCRVFNKKGDPNDKGPAAGLPSSTRQLEPKCEEEDMGANVETGTDVEGTYSVGGDVGIPNDMGVSNMGVTSANSGAGVGQVDDWDRFMERSDGFPEVRMREIPYSSFKTEEMLPHEVGLPTLTFSSSDDLTWPSYAPDTADDLSESSRFPDFASDIAGPQEGGGFTAGDGLQAGSYGEEDMSQLAFIQEFLSSDSYEGTGLSPEELEALLNVPDEAGGESTLAPSYVKSEPFGFEADSLEVQNGLLGVNDAVASEVTRPCIVIRSRPNVVSRERVDTAPMGSRIRMAIRVPKAVAGQPVVGSNSDQVHLGGGAQGGGSDAVVRNSARRRNAVKEEPESDWVGDGLGQGLYEASVAREVNIPAYVGTVERDSDLVNRFSQFRDRKLATGKRLGGDLSTGKVNSGGRNMASFFQAVWNNGSVSHLSGSSTEPNLRPLPVGLRQLLSSLPGFRKLMVPTNSISQPGADFNSCSDGPTREALGGESSLDTNAGSNDRSLPVSEKGDPIEVETDGSISCPGAPQGTVRQWRDNSYRRCSLGRESLRTRAIQLIGGTAACLSLFVGFISMVRLGVALIC